MISRIQVPSTDIDSRLIPVVFNIHNQPWSNAYGSNFFFMPTFEFINPTPNDGIGNSSFLFTVTNSNIATDNSQTRANIDFKIKKGRPFNAGPDMMTVPARIIGGLIIPYLDENNAILSFTVWGTIVDNADSLTLTVQLSGKWVSLCYGAMSGMDQTLPPPILMIGLSSILALVPSWVTLQNMDDPSFHTDLHLGDTPDFSQYQLYNISGFPLTTTPIFVPCSTMGTLYRHVYDTNIIEIGCKDPRRIGQIVQSPYEEMIELRNTDFYRVFRYKQDINRYLIIPNSYRIGLYSSEDGEMKAYHPNMLVQSVVDNSTTVDIKFLFKIMLLPDIPLYARKELEAQLHSLSPHPIVEYPTQNDFKYNVNIEELKEVPASKQSVALHLTIPLTLQRAVLLRDSIYNAAAFGNVRFESGEGVLFESTIILELRHLTGPWAEGPMEVILNADEVKLTNKVQQPINITSLLADFSSSRLTRIPVSIILEPSASESVPLSNTPIKVYPVYSLVQAENVPLPDEIRRYIEDVYTTIRFLDLINHQNHNIQQLELTVRVNTLNTLNELYTVPLEGNPLTGSLTIVFPLTQFLQKSTIEFQVKITLIAGEIRTTNWIEWKIPTNGNIVSLTWEMIEHLFA
ncbi:hypothetical protein COF82_02900 [Bacillus wiedmannii]|uniref:hypothetical protein n=1 Tax=Bacillus TaxID=1386 RepID=UPI000BFE4252|nr:MULTISPECIES: hypothetical protein [Bacillus]PHF34264.1 hypothetical protein COF82_02900 [Bacillus wiedmannii]